MVAPALPVFAVAGLNVGSDQQSVKPQLVTSSVFFLLLSLNWSDVFFIVYPYLVGQSGFTESGNTANHKETRQMTHQQMHTKNLQSIKRHLTELQRHFDSIDSTSKGWADASELLRTEAALREITDRLFQRGEFVRAW